MSCLEKRLGRDLLKHPRTLRLTKQPQHQASCTDPMADVTAAAPPSHSDQFEAQVSTPWSPKKQSDYPRRSNAVIPSMTSPRNKIERASNSKFELGIEQATNKARPGEQGAREGPCSRGVRQTSAESRGRALPPDSKVTGRHAHTRSAPHTHTHARKQGE
ncbi:hypothetical protein JYU34_010841 [Plutella xylostella]|uniref:Uncharacterized protein n=1 Tax=Plutella xylostella TaxID=51655 RepID=A0ABQ7QFE0_PLUXY|nr:hypothetical protein JYU34_010841 [Plutella xylostella]